MSNTTIVSVRQYNRSDSPKKTFHDYQQQLMGYPSVVCSRWRKLSLLHITTSICTKIQFLCDTDYTTIFTNRFRPIPLIDDYNPTYFDADYGRDPYWDTENYTQDLLQFQYVLDDIEHYQRTVHELQ